MTGVGMPEERARALADEQAKSIASGWRSILEWTPGTPAAPSARAAWPKGPRG